MQCNNYILVREVRRHLNDEAGHVSYEVMVLDAAELVSALLPVVEQDSELMGFKLDSMAKDKGIAQFRAYYTNDNNIDVTYSIYSIADLKIGQVTIGSFFGCEDKGEM